MGQTGFWLKIGPITTFLEMDRGDRFPPDAPASQIWVPGPSGAKFRDFGLGGWGPMYARVYPAMCVEVDTPRLVRTQSSFISHSTVEHEVTRARGPGPGPGARGPGRRLTLLLRSALNEDPW